MIIQTWYIQRIGKTRIDRCSYSIYACCNRSRIIQRMNNFFEPICNTSSILDSLFRNFVTDTPHNDTRMYSVVHHEVSKVFLNPLIKESIVAITAFSTLPLIETFGHNHHTQRVAKFNLPLRRHVMACTYSVASH